jgi:hypothetical protein
MPVRVCTAMRQHRASLKNPLKTVEEYLGTLEEKGPDQVRAGRPALQLRALSALATGQPLLCLSDRIIKHVIAAPAAVGRRMGFH